MIYSTQNRSFIHFQDVSQETKRQKSYREKQVGKIAYLNRYFKKIKVQKFFSFLLTYSFH